RVGGFHRANQSLCFHHPERVFSHKVLRVVNRWHCSRIPEYHSSFMHVLSRRVLTFVLVCCALAACRRQEDAAPPLVTPSVAMARNEASVGSPVEMTYKF